MLTFFCWAIVSILLIVGFLISLVYFLGGPIKEHFIALKFESGVLRIYNKRGIYEIHSKELIFPEGSDFNSMFYVGNKVYIIGRERYFKLQNVYEIYSENNLKFGFLKNEIYRVLKSV